VNGKLFLMADGEPRQAASPKDESILTEEFVEPILTVTREFLKYNDHLGPALFLLMENGEQGVIPLAYLDSLKSTKDKRAYFTSLGLSIRQAGDRIREALLVSDVWYIKPEEEGTLDITPSKHPNRKEAIAVVGRDAQGTRFTHVLQPFRRDSQDRPIFEPIEAKYNVPPEGEHRSTGLIDHLFD
jgi:hypothetical protein